MRGREGPQTKIVQRLQVPRDEMAYRSVLRSAIVAAARTEIPRHVLVKPLTQPLQQRSRTIITSVPSVVSTYLRRMQMHQLYGTSHAWSSMATGCSWN